MPGEAERTLTIWTLYDNPRDFPGHCVLRFWRIYPGVYEPNPIACLYDFNVDAIADMEQMGLTCIGREYADDLNIVGSWV